MIYATTLFCLCASPVPDGTLLFLKHSNIIVERFTHHPYTHVGIIIHVDGEPHVFEADRELGIHHMPLDKYLAITEDESVWIATPKKSYTHEQIENMRDYLSSVMGTPYSVMSFILQRPCRTIHCSELVANTLLQVNIIIKDNCSIVTPADVYDTLIESQYNKVTSLP